MANTPPNGAKYNGFNKYRVADLDAYSPLDTAFVQNNLVSNLESLYNHHFQTRVNILSPTNFDFGNGDSNAFEVGPFPVSALKNGMLAPLYIEIAGNIEGGSGTGSMFVALMDAERASGTGEYIWKGAAEFTSSTVYWQRISTTGSQLHLPVHEALEPRLLTRISKDDASPNIIADVRWISAFVFWEVNGSGVTEMGFRGLHIRECAFGGSL